MGFCFSKKIISSLLMKIDMYGSKVEINFQKQQTFNTVFGGLLTLIMFFSFGLGIWFFGQELVAKKQPTVITSERSVTQPKRIDINKNNLIVMMGIYNLLTSDPITDPTLFSVRAYQDKLMPYNDTATGQILKKTVPFEKKIKVCDINDVGITSLIPYFEKLKLSTYFCFEEQELYMEGDFDSEDFSEIYFYFEKCKNSTESQIICKTPQEINEQLKLTKLLIYLSDTIVDPLNYETPFEKKGINLYSPTSSTFPKELQIYFSNYYIESDIGVLYKDIQKQQSFHYTELKETSFFSDTNTIIRVLLRLQKQKENLMQRRYTRLADVIAQIGGLLKILTTFGSIIVYPFSKFYLNKAIIDEVFNFNQLDTNDQKIMSSNFDQQQNSQQLSNNPPNKKKISDFKQLNKTREKKIKLNSKQLQDNISENNNLQNQNNDNQTLNTFKKRKSVLEVVKKLFQVTKNIIKFKFSDIFSHIYFKKLNQNKEKHILIERGIEKVIKHLDVLFILNKLNEIDKLKSIILTYDQLKLFEYIPKPVISANEDKPSNLKQDQQLNTSTRQNIASTVLLQNIYTVFDEIKTDEQKAFDAYQGLINISKKKREQKQMKIQLI